MSRFYKHNICIFACLISFWSIDSASAQQSTAETTVAATSAGEPDAQHAAQGWALLERALNALATFNEDAARNALEELAAAYPGHPATVISAETLATLQARARRGETGSKNWGPNGEEKTGVARAELVAFQTAHGITLGIEFCTAVECDDSRLVVSMLALGGGAGLGLSLLASRDGVTPGFATLINSGTLWGAYNGAMIAVVNDTDSSIAGIMAGSQLAGIGVSALIWNQLHPTVGEVSMANSGGIWFGMLGLFGHMASDFSASDKVTYGTILALTDAGIIAGALLSQYEPMSRGRTLVIDSGGALGALVGIGTYVLINPEFERPTGMGFSAIAGTLAGLGTATFLTRNWDTPDDGNVTARWGIAPMEEGATLSLSGEF